MANALLICLLLVLAVAILLIVIQSVNMRAARGAAFRELAREGKLPADILAAAEAIDLDRTARRTLSRGDPAWERVHSGKRPRLTRSQLRAARKARAQEREAYLDVTVPGAYHYVIIFLVASILGLVMEMVFMWLTSGRTESRVGLVWGPFSPLYGFGACLLTMVLWSFRKAPAIHVFLISALLGGGLEQTTGMLMENLAHAQSWTYLGLPDAITQWIAWRFLVMWGFIGLVWCRVLMPEVIFRIGEPTTRAQAVIVSVLTAFLILDILATVYCFYRKAQRDAGIPAANWVDSYVDERFSDEFIANRFQNLVVGKDLEPNR